MTERVFNGMNEKQEDELSRCSDQHYFLEDEVPPITKESMKKGIEHTHRFTETEDVDVPFINCPPEKILYYEILKRACWDLKPEVPHMWRRTAFAWFKHGLEGREHPEATVSLLECIEILGLGENELDYLRVKFYEAQRFPCQEAEGDQLQKEREPYRIASRSFLARKRLPKCPEISAVCGICGDS